MLEKYRLIRVRYICATVTRPAKVSVKDMINGDIDILQYDNSFISSLDIALGVSKE